MFTFIWELLRRLILWLVCLFQRPPVPGTGPWTGDAATGRWDVVLTDSHVSAIHMAVLHTKEVLWFSGGRGFVTADPVEMKSWVWKVADIGTTAPPLNPPVETGPVIKQLFCAGHSFLRDGRLLVVGGSEPDGTGIKDVFIYDPSTKSWAPVASLDRIRWYPTDVTLPDGRVAAFSGRGDPTVHEVYEVGGAWKDLDMNRTLPIYPGLHLLSDGKLFYTGTYWGDEAVPDANTALLTPASPNWTPDAMGVTSGTWQPILGPNDPQRKEGMSVLLPPAEDDRVIVVGGDGTSGATSSLNSVEVIDFQTPTPAWQTIHPMSYQRSNVTVVILPDANVLVCGGGSRRRGPEVLECEMFDTSVDYMDPTVNPWTTVASLNHRRQYHSTCVLLPDGRVLAGGNDTGGQVMALEAYRPPYWFRGPRPRIWYAPKRRHIGQEFTVDSPDAPHIARVVLVRPMAVTHHTDSEQRLLDLPILRRGRCSLRVRAPSDHRVAPPGYYMLFLVNTARVPSMAKFIEIH